MKNIIISYENSNHLKQIIVEFSLFNKIFDKLMKDKKVANIYIDKREMQ